MTTYISAYASHTGCSYQDDALRDELEELVSWLPLQIADYDVCATERTLRKGSTWCGDGTWKLWFWEEKLKRREY